MTALKVVLGNDDANVALRLLLNDAGTYDINSGTGGVNGSIVLEYAPACSCVISRPCQ